MGSAGARPLAVAWFLFESRPPSSSASRLALFSPPNPKPSQGYRLEYVLFLPNALALPELTLSLAFADLATLAGFSSSAQPSQASYLRLSNISFSSSTAEPRSRLASAPLRHRLSPPILTPHINPGFR
ncbi:hypothetical protein C8Q74DRAFT_1374448 [Fomes fomentarius]|nr:hypothetical protein C8Q74DRAFT_1374448 [Fomes fomentarius]